MTAQNKARIVAAIAAPILFVTLPAHGAPSPVRHDGTRIALRLDHIASIVVDTSHPR